MMRKSLLIGIIVLALVLAIPSALCTVSWPEPEWIPMSPDDARPKLPDGKPMRRIKAHGYTPRVEYLEPFEPFYLSGGWYISVTDEAYNAETGEPVIPYENIQDRSGAAMAIWVVTFDGECLNPTYSYRGIGKWIHFENTDSSDPNDPEAVWYEAVAPLMLAMEHYYVFADGLEQGIYTVHSEIRLAGFPDWLQEHTIILSVGSP